MRLRNKKTGEIEESSITMDGDKIAVIVADMPLCGNSVLGEYDSLAELSEEWEDYEPLTRSDIQIIKEALMSFLGQEKLVGLDLGQELSRIIKKLDGVEIK